MSIKMILVAFVAALLTILGIYILALVVIMCFKEIKNQLKK